QWYKDSRLANNIKFKGSDDSFWVFYELLTDNIGVVNDKELSQLLAKLKSNNAKSAKANGKKEIKLNVAIYNNIISIEKQLESTGILTESLKEILFNAKSTFINYVNLRNKKPYKSRDELMAERISYLAKDPNNKIIVWAHNAHISKIVIVDNEIGLMGRDLEEEFGDDYHSIGLATLEGSYSFIEERFINGDHDYSETLSQSDIQSIKIPLWENSLASYGSDFYVDFSTLKKELNTDEIIGGMRLIGYGQEKKTDTYWIHLMKAFDSLIFIKQTSATKPLRD
ncbi:MAG: erythromycin esterase, partial [Nonlabens sp.]